MRQILYAMAVASLSLVLDNDSPPRRLELCRLPTDAAGWDGSPYCATCHSSIDASYHPELAAEVSQAQIYTTKHYKALEEGTFAGYKPLEPEKRKQLLEQAKKIDENASVKLEASAPTVAPGGNLTVTVTTKGGIGPVVGIMLLDEPLRYQARPIQGTGWFIASAPEVLGQTANRRAHGWIVGSTNSRPT